MKMYYAVLLLAVICSCYGADITTETAPSPNIATFDQTIDVQLNMDKDIMSCCSTLLF